MYISSGALHLHRIWFPACGNEKGSPVQVRRYPRSCKGLFNFQKKIKNTLIIATAVLCAAGRF